MAQSGKNPRGNKKYYHVLIDINRGELFDKYIREELNVKPTSWIRDIVYKFLQDNIDEKEYNEALKKDEENWKKVIQNRLQGRALSRLLNSINKKTSQK
jgi:CRISPR/Cas system CSM-associated protein Csm5 (group 7 of RAMP superfamily)